VSVWEGWQSDLLTAANVPDSDGNRALLYFWHKYDTSDCHNNPVDISHPATGSERCYRLSATRHARRYATRPDGAAAFATQLHAGQFPHLLAALASGDPWTVPHPANVVKDLKAWGSGAVANFYASRAKKSGGSGSGSGGGGVGLPKGHRGYHDFQRALARTLPTSLRRSRIIRGRVLRKLGAPRNLR
jgi:hypothetical protein